MKIFNNAHSFLIRDGSELSRDARSGNVLAEIVVKDSNKELIPVVAAFSAPWPLGKKHIHVL